MKKIVFLLYILALLFSSCSKSSNKERKDFIKLITIEYISEATASENITFEYENEEIRHIFFSGNHPSLKYSFRDDHNKINVSIYNSQDGSTSQDVYEMEKGFIYHIRKADENTISYNYTNRDQISQIIYPGTRHNFTWIGDTIDNIHLTTENQEIKFHYTTHKNITNIDVNLFIAGYRFESFFINRWFGRKTSHLASGNSEYDVEYTFDRDGYLISALKTPKDNTTAIRYTFLY